MCLPIYLSGLHEQFNVKILSTSLVLSKGLSMLVAIILTITNFSSTSKEFEVFAFFVTGNPLKSVDNVVDA